MFFVGYIDIDVKGTVKLFYGKVADIPSGWSICDGTNGTPDMQDLVSVGANADDGTEPTCSVEGSAKKTGGVNSHLHTFTDGGHSHNLTEITGLASGGDWGTDTTSTAASGITGEEFNIMSYRALYYIMKL